MYTTTNAILLSVLLLQGCCQHFPGGPVIKRRKWKSLSHVQICDPMDCGPPGSSVHEILQAGILEWVAFSRGSAKPRDLTQISGIAGGFFTVWANREAHLFKLFFFLLKYMIKPAGLAESTIHGLHGIPLRGCRWWTPLQVSAAWLLGPLRGLAWLHGHLPLLWSQRIQSSSRHLRPQSRPVCGAFD